ncbi:ABC transporter substrate-binding protein [Cohnella thailandensis]|uniref:Sugar ABC transporter substrate-binding protein n=1 Tax=Cohnella thailandensis TaxID=557557 RepID=A0A841SV75_9BACL|nr:sugar ABC transporter substrate-binding protein [Cohnella thailandensis]MBB6634098.1 sugar ABC transporter substrate-binding protein [Cohnella thailandensis]MBP1972410.1 multiple sugar transport system substrate-binding protein [Cohnella thailandensis]
MSKHWKTGLVTLAVAGLLTACGSNGNNNDSSASPAASSGSPAADEPITLKFASWSISEEATKGALEEMANQFAAQHPNVKIEFVGIPFGDIKQQTFVMASSGNAPDIIQTFTASFPTYAASDIVRPLDDLLGQDYINDLLPSYKEDYTYDGKLMGVPWAPSPYVLYWNKELFKKAGLPDRAPQTYDEMLEFAGKISKLKTDSGEQVYGLGEATEKLPINGMIALRNIYSFNGSVFDADGKVNVNTPEVIATLKYYQDIVKDGLSPQGAKLKDLRNLFSIGRLGMYADGYYGRKVFQNLSGKGEAFDSVWGVSLIPANKTGESVSIGEAHGLVISKDSKHPEMAAEFIKFLTDRDMIKLYHDNSDVMSARQSIGVLPEFNATDFDKTLNDQMHHIKALPTNNQGLEQAYLEIAEAVQKVTVAGESPEKAASELDAKLKQIMK